MIRVKQKIKGFQLPDKTMVKIAQYADHTTLFVYDIASIHTCISVLRTFEAESGAKVNLDKTEGLGLFSFQGRNDHPKFWVYTCTLEMLMSHI